MNTEHIKAILDANGVMATAKVGGITIASQGNIAAAIDYPVDNDPKKNPIRERMVASWEKWAVADWPEVQPGSLFHSGRYYLRQLGNTYIQECFFRCFAGPETKWFCSGEKHAPLLVKRDGFLLAAVGPMENNSGVLELDQSKEPNEEDIFSGFATPGNNYYLQPNRSLVDKLESLREELDEVIDELDELEGRKQRLQIEIKESEAAVTRRSGKSAA